MVTHPEEHLALSQTQRLGRLVFITASEWSCRTPKLAGSQSSWNKCHTIDWVSQKDTLVHTFHLIIYNDQVIFKRIISV